jgi:CubicO group peptidase (beta-lactamase class C family)
MLLLAGCATVRAPRQDGTPLPAARSAARDWSPATNALDSAIAAGAAPGAVLAVSSRGERFTYGAGRLGMSDAARPGPATVYDLASLTKVIGLTTAMMLAVDEGRVALDNPARLHVPAFAGGARDSITIRQLLVHAAGLPPFRPLFRETATRAEALALTDTTALVTAPGAAEAYSDLGIIVLTQALEAAYGERLDSLLARRVFAPLGMRNTRYLPPPEWLPRIAPTEHDAWRGRVVHGEVHDENTVRLDGVSGHAGLFSTADDLLVFGEWILDRWHGRRPADRRSAGGADAPFLVSEQVVRAFTVRQNLVAGSTRALGWDTPSERGSAGTRLSRASIGHTGFTGTSIWIDPTRDLVIVLLSNRVHPTRDNARWHPVRGRMADLVVGILEPTGP